MRLDRRAWTLSPSEKPGERQRAWLITGEKSDPSEPERERGKPTRVRI